MRRALAVIGLLVCVMSSASRGQDKTAPSTASARAVDELRRLGTELTADWVDLLGEANLPGLDDEGGDLFEVDLETLEPLRDRELAARLSQVLGHPLRDPWGSEYELRWSPPTPETGQFENSTTAPSVGYSVRSCGPDRICATKAHYTVGPIGASDADDPSRDDLVWANGFFIRWPSR